MTNKLIFLIGIATLYVALFTGFRPKVLEDTIQPVSASRSPIYEATEVSQRETPDPCTLKVVECPNEPKTVYAPVTAYTSTLNQTDETPCIAADGSDICIRHARGEKICATNDYPFGTILVIETLGNCIISDRMNKKFNGTFRVDYYMGYDTKRAQQFGIRRLKISAQTL